MFFQKSWINDTLREILKICKFDFNGYQKPLKLHTSKSTFLVVMVNITITSFKITKEYALVLKEMMVKDDPIIRTQVIYIATSEMYAKTNNFKYPNHSRTNLAMARLVLNHYLPKV
jgi:hypothetical protein